MGKARHAKSDTLLTNVGLRHKVSITVLFSVIWVEEPKRYYQQEEVFLTLD